MCFVIELFQKITQFFISFVLEINICLNIYKYVSAVFLIWKDGFMYYLKKGEKENEKQGEVCQVIKNTSG